MCIRDSPDSIIEGQSAHDSRMLAGKYLAQEFPVEADVVIGVPDSGLSAAMGYAKESGIPYDIGFVKNKYIGRTFIQPSQAMRENSVRIKLNVLKLSLIHISLSYLNVGKPRVLLRKLL